MKKFKPVLDLNRSLKEVTLKVTEKGNRQTYSNSNKSSKDVQDFPYYVRAKIIADPSGINIDSEIQIKLRSINNIEVGQEITLSPGKYQVIGGQLTFWANRSKFHGKDWIFINLSAKGDHIDDWN